MIWRSNFDGGAVTGIKAGKQEREASGEIETELLGYLGLRILFYIGMLKDVEGSTS